MNRKSVSVPVIATHAVTEGHPPETPAGGLDDTLYLVIAVQGWVWKMGGLSAVLAVEFEKVKRDALARVEKWREEHPRV